MKRIVVFRILDVNDGGKKCILWSKSGDFPRPSSHTDLCSRHQGIIMCWVSLTGFVWLQLLPALTGTARSFFIHPHSSWCYYNRPPSLHVSCLLYFHESSNSGHKPTRRHQLIYRLERQGALPLYLFPTAFPSSLSLTHFSPPTSHPSSLQQWAEYHYGAWACLINNLKAQNHVEFSKNPVSCPLYLCAESINISSVCVTVCVSERETERGKRERERCWG